MFSLSKGEPPTPPSAPATSPPNTERCELPQLRKTEAPLRSLSDSVESCSSADQQEIEGGGTPREIPPIQTPSAPMEPDSGFEASPCFLSSPSNFHFLFECNELDNDDVFLSEAEMVCANAILLEREDGDNLCPDCGEVSCTCSRAESSATVRAAVSSYTDPNTCDSDSSSRSSSPQSPPPPSSWSIPVTCSHIHNDRLPCPRCSGDETLAAPSSSGSYLQNIVASRSYPGSYPAALLNWWTQTSPSSSAFPPRGADAAAVSRTSNRSDDRRSARSRRRQIDSDASSLSSCDENCDEDELFPTVSEEGSYLENLGTMTEDMSVASPEQLADLARLPSELSSRRIRSQSVSIPLDHAYLREIGTTLRRLSNDFENRLAERDCQPRRSSLTSFLNLNWPSLKQNIL